MKAVRLQPPPSGASPYSSDNPATASALYLDPEVPEPTPLRAGDLVVRVKATTVIRDNLTWPEIYQDPPALPGNDFSGIVHAVSGDGDGFKIGDEVYGMTGAARGGTWAEYALVKPEEAYLKPSHLSWEEAAALPLTAMTADQALFDHAKLDLDAEDGRRKKILITGAAGNVGTILVRFAAATGHRVVAATSSSRRDEAFLLGLGAETVVDYEDLHTSNTFDVIIDTKGGATLRACWELIADAGSLVSVDSSSWNFVEEHKQLGLTENRNHVHAVFFVVEPSKKSMERVTNTVLAGRLQGTISRTMPLQEAPAAYDLCHSRNAGAGKIILLP